MYGPMVVHVTLSGVQHTAYPWLTSHRLPEEEDHHTRGGHRSPLDSFVKNYRGYQQFAACQEPGLNSKLQLAFSQGRKNGALLGLRGGKRTRKVRTLTG